MNKSKIVLFGGNGFVGTAIAEELVHQNIEVVCVSRTGSMPIYLQNVEWAQKVNWVKGDALKPDADLLNGASAVISLIGSPPVPTFSKGAYQQQLAMNSEPNLAVIEATKKSSVTRLVLLGAHLPNLVKTDKFAYAKGKRLCEEAAVEFANSLENRTAIVLKPTAIYGVRHSQSGKPINIGAVMKPIASLQTMLPNAARQYLPETIVSVKAVASAAVNACLDDEFVGKFSVISNQQIIDQED